MKADVNMQAEQYIRQGKKRRNRGRIVAALSVLVALTTTYVLMLPGITMERDAQCGVEAHQHSEACYVSNLICQEQEREASATEIVQMACDFKPHEHTDECYRDSDLACGKTSEYFHEHDAMCLDAQGNLICTLTENIKHEHTGSCYEDVAVLNCQLAEDAGHLHSEACYTLQPAQEPTCGLAENLGHTHTDTCITTSLTCGMEEQAGHIHGESCQQSNIVLTCTTVEVAAHAHGDGCYQTVSELTCGQNEGEGAHTHSDNCYINETNLTCGQNEGEGAHSHGEGCYTAEQKQICDKAEGEGAHAHGEGCFTTEHALTCTVAEHAHGDACRDAEGNIICGVQEHAHGDACYTAVQNMVCTMEESAGHAHGTDCFTTENKLSCSLTETAGHAHGDVCYTTTTKLNCSTAETSGHAHADACYTTKQEIVCTQSETAGHAHGEGCYTTSISIVCGQNEGDGAHTHSEACYTTAQSCGLAEGEGAHQHGEACYALVSTLACGLDEGAGAHVHSETCYIAQRQETCNHPELHEHESACYETDVNGKRWAICELAELQEHQHSSGCLQTETAIDEGHAHGEACYEAVLVCEIAEHVHTDECYPDAAEEPTDEPTVAPAETSTAVPDVTPEAEPTAEPTATTIPKTTEEPTVTPSEETEPTVAPTETSTAVPDVTPEAEPTAEPTATTIPETTEEPTVTPSEEAEPTVAPTETSTAVPDVTPEAEPTAAPTATTIPEATEQPTTTPSEETEPTVAPTETSTAVPDVTPEAEPSAEPTATSIPEITEEPTAVPMSTPESTPAVKPNVENIPVPTVQVATPSDMNGEVVTESVNMLSTKTDLESVSSSKVNDKLSFVEDEKVAVESGLTGTAGNEADKSLAITTGTDLKDVAANTPIDEQVEYFCYYDEHMHDSICYDVEGHLTCWLDEHTHTEDCLYRCGFETHIHADTCYVDGQVVCLIPEHMHSADCDYFCGFASHAHGDTCYSSDGRLICMQPEHMHTSECESAFGTMMLFSVMYNTESGYVELNDYITSVKLEYRSGDGDAWKTVISGADELLHIDQDGQLRFELSYILPTGTLTDNDQVVYEIPATIKEAIQDAGYVLEGGKNNVGEYTINENGDIVITFFAEYVKRNTGTDGGTGSPVHGTISFKASVDALEVDDNGKANVSFKENVSLGIVIDDYTNKTNDLTVVKTATNVDSVEGTVDYQITVGSEKGTPDVITLNDVMSGGDLALDGDIVVKKGDTEVSALTLDIAEDNKSFSLLLPELAAGESYVITYSAKLPDNFNGAVYADNKVQVESAYDGGGKLVDEATVNTHFENKVIEKFASVDQNSNTITWTITINQAKQDISGWTLSDTINGETLPTGTDITLTDADGKSEKIPLPYTFPENSTSTYTITYTTTHELTSIGTSSFVNIASLTDKEEYTYTAQDKRDLYNTPISKQAGGISNITSREDGTRIAYATWTMKIDTSGGKIAGPWTLSDKLGDGQYFTYKQMQDIETVVYKNLASIGATVTFYQGDTTEVTLGEGVTCNKYVVTVPEGKTLEANQIITFTYQSTVELGDGNSSKYFSNWAEMKQGDKTVTSNASNNYTPAVTKWDRTQGGSTTQYENGVPNGTDKTVLEWAFKVDLTGVSPTGDLTITEQLPKGVTFDRLVLQEYCGKILNAAFSFANSAASVFIDESTISAQIGYKDTTNGTTITITVPSAVVQKILGADNKSIIFYVDAKLDNSKLDEVAMHTNSVSVKDGNNSQLGFATQSQVITVYKENRNLIKTHDHTVTKPGADVDLVAFDGNIIPYVLDVNLDANDLVYGSDVLMLDDVLEHHVFRDDPSEYSLELVENSIQVYRVADDGEETMLSPSSDNEIGESEYAYVYSAGPVTIGGNTVHCKHQLSFTLRDNQHLRIKYKYVLKNIGGGEVAIRSLNNVATLYGSGENSTTSSDSIRISLSESNATARINGFYLYKVAADNTAIRLQGAEFNVYEWAGPQSDGDNDWSDEFTKPATDSEGNKIPTLVTDENGLVMLEGLRPNKAYMLLETKAPDGYECDQEPYFFYLYNNEKTTAGDLVYPFTQTPGYGEYANQNGQNFTWASFVHRHYENDTFFFKDYKNGTELEVVKAWADAEGNATAAPMIDDEQVSQVEFKLFQVYTDENGVVHKNDNIVFHEYKQETTTDESGNEVTTETMVEHTLEAANNRFKILANNLWSWKSADEWPDWVLPTQIEVDGKRYNCTYAVQELNVPYGYVAYNGIDFNGESNYADGTITITNRKSATTSIEVKKAWAAENDHAHVTGVQVQIVRRETTDAEGKVPYGEDGNRTVLTDLDGMKDGLYTLDAQNNWQVEVKGLPLSALVTMGNSADGQIVYYWYDAEEVAVLTGEGTTDEFAASNTYTQEFVDGKTVVGATEGTVTMTNTKEVRTSLKVQKEWANAQDGSQAEPQDVDINVYRVAVASGSTPATGTVKLTGNLASWLPSTEMTFLAGTTVTLDIERVNGNSALVIDKDGVRIGYFDENMEKKHTCSFEVKDGETTISLAMYDAYWAPYDDDLASITLTTTAPANVAFVKKETIKANETLEITKLPAKGVVDGAEVDYYYFVEEINVPDGYTVSYSENNWAGIRGSIDDTPSEPIVITNTKENEPEKVKISAEKQWKDSNGNNLTGDLPEIKLQLYRNTLTQKQWEQFLADMNQTVGGDETKQTITVDIFNVNEYGTKLVSHKFDYAPGTTINLKIEYIGDETVYFWGWYTKDGTTKGWHNNPTNPFTTEEILISKEYENRLVLETGINDNVQENWLITPTVVSGGDSNGDEVAEKTDWTQIGIETAEPIGDPITLSGTTWSYTWPGQTVEEGKYYYYYVDEVSVPEGYTKDIEYSYDASNQTYTYTITNTMPAVQSQSIWVEKVYTGNNNNAHMPPVTVTLKRYKVPASIDVADNPKPDEKYLDNDFGEKTMVLGAAESSEGERTTAWKYEWVDIETSAAENEEEYVYYYFVEETPVEGYIGEITGNYVSTNTEQSPINITNTPTKLTISKQWQKANGEAWSEQESQIVYVKVLDSDGKAIDPTGYRCTGEVVEIDGVKCIKMTSAASVELSALPVGTYSVQEVAYEKAQEDQVSGETTYELISDGKTEKWSVSYSKENVTLNDSTTSAELVVKNTAKTQLTTSIDITVNKKWVGDTASDRPEKIYVNLLRATSTDGGNEWSAYVLHQEDIELTANNAVTSDSNTWTVTISDLAVAEVKDGVNYQYKYKLQEEPVTNYSTAYEPSEGILDAASNSSVTITNFKNKYGQLKVGKTWVWNTDRESIQYEIHQVATPKSEEMIGKEAEYVEVTFGIYYAYESGKESELAKVTRRFVKGSTIQWKPKWNYRGDWAPDVTKSSVTYNNQPLSDISAASHDGVAYEYTINVGAVTADKNEVKWIISNSDTNGWYIDEIDGVATDSNNNKYYIENEYDIRYWTHDFVVSSPVSTEDTLYETCTLPVGITTDTISNLLLEDAHYTYTYYIVEKKSASGFDVSYSYGYENNVDTAEMYNYKDPTHLTIDKQWYDANGIATDPNYSPVIDIYKKNSDGTETKVIEGHKLTKGTGESNSWSTIFYGYYIDGKFRNFEVGDVLYVVEADVTDGGNNSLKDTFRAEYSLSGNAGDWVTVQSPDVTLQHYGGWVAIKNTVKNPYVLPETGGEGTQWYTGVGAVLIGIALTLLYKGNKRKRRAEE